MRRMFLSFAAGGLTLLGASHAFAQAVQLPTFRSTGVSTTVSVPDRGGMVLGGVDHASSGSTTRGLGPLRSRAIGSNVGGSSTSVHATIIDLDELDRQVLAEAARRREARGEALVGQPPRTQVSPEKQAIANKAAFLSQHVGKRDSSRPATTTHPSTSSKNVANSPERPLRLPAR